jgi:hypothetical protein
MPQMTLKLGPVLTTTVVVWLGVGSTAGIGATGTGTPDRADAVLGCCWQPDPLRRYRAGWGYPGRCSMAHTTLYGSSRWHGTG